MKLCGFEVGLSQPFFLIAGPCVVESESLAIETAGLLKEIATELNIPFIYKSSYDKANRSSLDSFRGLGIEKGLEILSLVTIDFTNSSLYSLSACSSSFSRSALALPGWRTGR